MASGRASNLFETAIGEHAFDPNGDPMRGFPFSSDRSWAASETSDPPAEPFLGMFEEATAGDIDNDEADDAAELGPPDEPPLGAPTSTIEPFPLRLIFPVNFFYVEQPPAQDWSTVDEDVLIEPDDHAIAGDGFGGPGWAGSYRQGRENMPAFPDMLQHGSAPAVGRAELIRGEPCVEGDAATNSSETKMGGARSRESAGQLADTVEFEIDVSLPAATVREPRRPGAEVAGAESASIGTLSRSVAPDDVTAVTPPHDDMALARLQSGAEPGARSNMLSPAGDAPTEEVCQPAPPAWTRSNSVAGPPQHRAAPIADSPRSEFERERQADRIAEPMGHVSHDSDDRLLRQQQPDAARALRRRGRDNVEAAVTPPNDAQFKQAQLASPDFDPGSSTTAIAQHTDHALQLTRTEDAPTQIQSAAAARVEAFLPSVPAPWVLIAVSGPGGEDVRAVVRASGEGVQVILQAGDETTQQALEQGSPELMQRLEEIQRPSPADLWERASPIGEVPADLRPADAELNGRGNPDRRDASSPGDDGGGERQGQRGFDQRQDERESTAGDEEFAHFFRSGGKS